MLPHLGNNANRDVYMDNRRDPGVNQGRYNRRQLEYDPNSPFIKNPLPQMEMQRHMSQPQLPPGRDFQAFYNPSISNPFEKFVLDELRNLKSELTSEVGYRYAINDKLQSGASHVVMFEEKLNQLRRQVDALNSEVSLSVNNNPQQNEINQLHGNMQSISNEVKRFQSKISNDSQSEIQSVHSRISTEVENLRSLIVKQLGQSSAAEEQFRDSTRKQWDVALTAEKGVKELSMAMAQYENDHVHQFRKLQESIHSANVLIKKLELRCEDMNLNYQGKLEEAYVSIQNAQSNLFQHEIDALKNYFLRKLTAVEVNFTESMTTLRKEMQQDRDDMKLALQELRTAVNAEVTARKTVDGNIASNLENAIKINEDKYNQFNSEIATMRNSFTEYMSNVTADFREFSTGSICARDKEFLKLKEELHHSDIDRKESKEEITESLTVLMNKFNDLFSKYKYTTHLCNDMKEAIEAETIRRISDIDEIYKASGLENPNNVSLVKAKHNIKKLQMDVLAKSTNAKEEIEEAKNKIQMMDNKVTSGTFSLALGMFSPKTTS